MATRGQTSSSFVVQDAVTSMIKLENFLEFIIIKDNIYQDS
jgi:hypothetical protein